MGSLGQASLAGVTAHPRFFTSPQLLQPGLLFGDFSSLLKGGHLGMACSCWLPSRDIAAAIVAPHLSHQSPSAHVVLPLTSFQNG